MANESLRARISTLLTRIHELYGKPLSVELLALYLEIYQRFDYATVKEAYKQAVERSQFVPKPANIVGIIEQTERDQVQQKLRDRQCCRVMGKKGFCGQRQDLVRVNTGGLAEYMCRTHYEQTRRQCSKFTETDKRADIVRTLCKKCSVNPQDFYVSYCDHLRKEINLKIPCQHQRHTQRLADNDYRTRLEGTVIQFMVKLKE